VPSPPESDLRLIAPDEPPAFEIFGRGGRYPALLVCDHGGNRVPRSLGALQLSSAELSRHIAWDIGARALAGDLAERLGLRGVAANYSRLVIDCNRMLEDPTSIPEESDGVRIPGNIGLPQAARERRERECFWPYHEAIDAEFERLRHDRPTEPDRAPALLAIHSFTPALRGVARPWQCGVLSDQDLRIATPLLGALRARGDLVVGDNEPYSGRDPAGYTNEIHAQQRGWPEVCIEVRQDELASAVGIARWAEILALALEPILGDPALYQVRRPVRR